MVINATSSRGINIVAHEIGHLMGFFTPAPSIHDQWQGYYSLMTYEGMGIMNSFERRFFNWIDNNQLETISTTQLHYALPDFETTGKAVKIPINSDDYYLLENRQRIGFYSSTNWNRWPAGNGYSVGQPIVPDEGLIINKYANGPIYPDPGMKSYQIQCADHQWLYENENEVFKYPFNKLIPCIYNNDYHCCFEMDIFGNSEEYSPYTMNCVNQSGTTCTGGYDRKYHPDVWGDDKDLWDIGYNQVFSPWSNPKPVINNFAIEIVEKNPETKTLYLDIRFENPQICSPAKPLALKVDKYFASPTSYIFSPRLRWNCNTDPNMQTNSFYKIYRAELTGNGEFYEIATVQSIGSGNML